MLAGKRFRLRTPTIGVDKTGESKIAVTIPAGVTIEIVRGTSPNDSMVDVVWNGRTMVMFIQDIQERGEEVTNQKP